MPFAQPRLEPHRPLRIERRHTLCLEIPCGVEGEAIHARRQRPTVRIQRPHAYVAVGDAAVDRLPLAVVGTVLEQHAHADRGAALRRIEDVSSDGAHCQDLDSNSPDAGPRHSPCWYTISPRSIVIVISPLSRAPSYGVTGCR